MVTGRRWGGSCTGLTSCETVFSSCLCQPVLSVTVRCDEFVFSGQSFKVLGFQHDIWRTPQLWNFFRYWFSLGLKDELIIFPWSRWPHESRNRMYVDWSCTARQRQATAVYSYSDEVNVRDWKLEESFLSYCDVKLSLLNNCFLQKQFVVISLSSRKNFVINQLLMWQSAANTEEIWAVCTETPAQVFHYITQVI